MTSLAPPRPPSPSSHVRSSKQSIVPIQTMASVIVELKREQDGIMKKKERELLTLNAQRIQQLKESHRTEMAALRRHHLREITEVQEAESIKCNLIMTERMESLKSDLTLHLENEKKQKNQMELEHQEELEMLSEHIAELETSHANGSKSFLKLHSSYNDALEEAAVLGEALNRTTQQLEYFKNKSTGAAHSEEDLQKLRAAMEKAKSDLETCSQRVAKMEIMEAMQRDLVKQLEEATLNLRDAAEDIENLKTQIDILQKENSELNKLCEEFVAVVTSS